MNSVIQQFFDKSFENNLNFKMFYRDYSLDCASVLAFVNRVNEIDFNTLIDSIRMTQKQYFLTSRDVFQFSSFDDCTLHASRKLKDVNDNGFNYVDFGKILLGDEIERKSAAYRKYGENHSKTAHDLGLIQIKHHTVFLSCFGNVYDTLDQESRDKFIRRLALRTNLIQFLIKSNANEIKLRESVRFLSDSTYRRRISNVKTVIDLVNNNDEINESNKLIVRY